MRDGARRRRLTGGGTDGKFATVRAPDFVLLIVGLVLAPAVLGAQGEELACERGAPEVRRLFVEGATDPSATEVQRALATSPSSWLRRVLSIPLGAKHCLDSAELSRDRLRLKALQAQHGRFEARSEIEVRRTGDRTVDIVFRVVEGARARLDSVHFSGLDSVPRVKLLATRLFRDLSSDDFSEPEILVAVDSVQSQLRETGYVRAPQAAIRLVRDSARARAWVDVVYAPGRRVVVGAVDVVIRANTDKSRPRVSEQAVRRRLSVSAGETARPSLLLRSQRELFELDAYQLVRLDTTSMARGTDADTMRVTVTLVESLTRSLRVGAGWATLDCFRTQARYIDRSVLGTARRLELDVRLSKIGRGEPLGFAPSLCADAVRSDPFSDRLNYFVGATTDLTDLFGRKVTPQVTLYSESRSESFAYRRDTPIGARMSIAAPLTPTLTGTTAVQYEFSRTAADEAVACLIFNACTADEVIRRQQGGSLATFTLGVQWDVTTNRIDPLIGLRARIESRLGIASLAGTSGAFDRLLGDVTLFRPLSPSVTLAARIQLGAIAKLSSSGGTTVNAVPLQERFFAGGQSSIRGFPQNLLGDVVYIVNTIDTVARDVVGGTATLAAANGIRNPSSKESIRRVSPVGGEAMLVTNLELRLHARSLGAFQLAAFVDAGQLRRDPEELFRFSDVKVTPGFGVRLATQFGLFRLDVGYNPYPSTGGPAYFATTNGGRAPTGLLLCVSPGSTEQVVTTGAGTGNVIRSSSDCPSSYRPGENTSVLSRLTFHFGIGQAF